METYFNMVTPLAARPPKSLKIIWFFYDFYGSPLYAIPKRQTHAWKLSCSRLHFAIRPNAATARMIGVRVFPFGGPAVIPLCGRNTAGPLRAQAVSSDEDIG